MKRRYIWLFALALSLMCWAMPAGAAKVIKMGIDGIIDGAVLDYIDKGIDQAEAEKAAAVVITIDTPGGILDSTKKIVQRFLDSKVPVVVYVSPKGASATSAGMMITIGANLAVMAPGTNIGASHPVMMPFMVQYQPIPENDVMMKKATQDTVGWVRSICEVRGRNADWAEKAVRDSSSITAQDALKQNVIDGVVENLDQLIPWLDGKEVKLSKDKTVKIDTKGAVVETVQMKLGEMLQHIINNPNVILVLLLLGALGIGIEFKAPGTIFPGMIGAACILVALVAPSLTMNYIGLVLIVVGIALLVAELKIVSHGALTIAGIIFLTYGAMMLFQTERSWNVSVSWSLLIPLIVFVVLVILVVGQKVLAVHRKNIETGAEAMQGAEGTASSDLNPSGKVAINGEFWNAESLSGEIKSGEKIVVESMDKFLVKVKRQK
jgi:membrane-bound serine protease (ClpP class)